ncbi:MAG: YrdB family protein [Bacteroidales bacterium]
MERITGALWLRGFLELAGLVFGGIWGYRLDSGGIRFFFALGIPLIMAIVWAVFNVPDDPSRGGPTPVPVGGRLRLLLEAGLFGFAVFAAWSALGMWPALVFLALVVFSNYQLRHRLVWVWKKKRKRGFSTK